jgi:hypothetical protein
VLPPGPDQRDPDSLLVPDPGDFADAAAYPARDRAHLDERLAAGRHLTDGACYILDRLERDASGLRLSGRLGRYFDMMTTCDALDHELRRYAANGAAADSLLPLRTAFHAAVSPERVIHDGAGRSAIIGVATLTVFNQNGDYRVIVTERAANLATGAGLLHVMPAFVLQPFEGANGPVHHWTLTGQILREFGEELFAMPEADAFSGADSPDYFMAHPAVADLQAMLDDGRAELHVTGVAVNLLSTRPEVCALLLIHDPDWPVRWAEELDAARHTERLQTHLVPVHGDASLLAALPAGMVYRFAPQGAAALWLGLDQARAALGGGK